jgi:hypothetical protein
MEPRKVGLHYPIYFKRLVAQKLLLVLTNITHSPHLVHLLFNLDLRALIILSLLVVVLVVAVQVAVAVLVVLFLPALLQHLHHIR